MSRVILESVDLTRGTLSTSLLMIEGAQGGIEGAQGGVTLYNATCSTVIPYHCSSSLFQADFVPQAGYL